MKRGRHFVCNMCTLVGYASGTCIFPPGAASRISSPVMFCFSGGGGGLFCLHHRVQ